MKILNEAELYSHIGECIRQRRKSREINLTQDDLAKLIGVTRASIANIESGNQRSPLHLIYRIFLELNMDPHQVFPSLDAVEVKSDDPDIEVHVGDKRQRLPSKTATAIQNVVAGNF